MSLVRDNYDFIDRVIYCYIPFDFLFAGLAGIVFYACNSDSGYDKHEVIIASIIWSVIVLVPLLWLSYGMIRVELKEIDEKKLIFYGGITKRKDSFNYSHTYGGDIRTFGWFRDNVSIV